MNLKTKKIVEDQPSFSFVKIAQIANNVAHDFGINLTEIVIRLNDEADLPIHLEYSTQEQKDDDLFVFNAVAYIHPKAFEFSLGSLAIIFYSAFARSMGFHVENKMQQDLKKQKYLTTILTVGLSTVLMSFFLSMFFDKNVFTLDWFLIFITEALFCSSIFIVVLLLYRLHSIEDFVMKEFANNHKILMLGFSFEQKFRENKIAQMHNNIQRFNKRISSQYRSKYYMMDPSRLSRKLKKEILKKEQ